MMLENENDLILLESYLDHKDAYKDQILLDKNKIYNKYLCSRSNIEQAYLVSNSNPTEIWVNKVDFENAYRIISQSKEYNEQGIQMNDFSDKELIDIVKNEGEWHESFVSSAKELIEKRNISINEKKTN